MLKSLADQYIESRLACIVWQMRVSDLDELLNKDIRAYEDAVGELGYRRRAEALDSYFFNHKHGTLKFYNFTHIPCPFFYDDGRVEWLVVPQHQHTVYKEDWRGEPRYTEWGCDVAKVEMKRIRFKRRDMQLLTHGYPHKVIAYVESMTTESDQKVKRYACNILFSMKRNKIK